MKTITGHLRKMGVELRQPVAYTLVLSDRHIPLNAHIGQFLELHFTGNIHCIQCGRKTRQSFQQGYCFVCMKRLAECQFCVIHPEKCLVMEGSCPDNDWAHAQCAQSHIVYLANSSGLKVGITRCNQVPTRWIDQGACQALPIFKVANRYQSGIIEVCLKQFVADRTDFRKLLKRSAEGLDLVAQRTQLMAKARDAVIAAITPFLANDIMWLSDSQVVHLEYPVQHYPEKIVNLSFDKTEIVKGKLQGIKGQYLLLDTGVINIRKFAGYEIECRID